MIINVWKNYSKRKNSTARPSVGLAQSKQVNLKENCSVESPVFLLQGIDTDINYVQAFGHYYFVTDITILSNDIMQINCSQDVLATYYNEIKNSSQYVLYDTTPNIEIIDRRLNQFTSCATRSNSVAFRDDVTPNSGAYILTLTGEAGVGVYSVTRQVLDYIYPDISTAFDAYIQGTDPFDAIKAGFMQLVSSGNLPENIKDVRWIPFTVQGDTLVSPLKVGKYEILRDGTPIGARRIDSRLISYTAQVSIPWQHSDWRNCEPYTTLTLYIPFVGVVSYPSSQLQGKTYLQIKSCLDAYTGDISIEVYAGSDYIIGSYGATTGVSMYVGGLSHSPMSIIGGATSATIGAIAGNLPAMAEGITTAFSPYDSTVGGISGASGAGMHMNILCTTYCHNTTDEPSDVSAFMGTPTFAYKSLSGLTGYVQCSNASVRLAGREGDTDAVNSFLDSGIYLE